MKIYIERENKEKKVIFNGSLKDLLDKIGINKEVVIVMRDNEILIDDEEVHDSDEIKVISVVSGG